MTKLLAGATDALAADRHCCTGCRFLWQGAYCLQHRAAGLMTRALAADFTQLKQRCGAFAPQARRETK